jgi:transcriptional regulator with XRE-family HTH domain
VSGRERIYEQERLLLHMQERLAEAIERSGMKRAEVARRLGVNRAFVTQILSRGRGLTVKTIASVLHATGYRLVLKLERLAAEPPPGKLEEEG